MQTTYIISRHFFTLAQWDLLHDLCKGKVLEETEEYACMNVYVPQVVEREELQHLKELKSLHTLSLAHNPVDVGTSVVIQDTCTCTCMYVS